MEALQMPGGKQMQYLKRLMLSIDFVLGQARPDMVVDPKPFYEHISVFASKSAIGCYVYLGKEFSLDLKEYNNKSVSG